MGERGKNEGDCKNQDGNTQYRYGAANQKTNGLKVVGNGQGTQYDTPRTWQDRSASMHAKFWGEGEFSVYSQWGQDGIIQHLIGNLDISREVFIEFGTQNYVESNTRFLLTNNNWSGLIIDGGEADIDYVRHDEIYWMYNVKAVCEFITVDNINKIFSSNGITGDIGLMSVDIDGVDFWVWRAIECVSPDIVVCEYNPRFGKDKAVTVPYDSAFERFKHHYSGIYWGASIKAMTLLANQKGYALVDGTRLGGSDAFFVKRGLLNAAIKERSIDEVYARNQFQDSRDENGNLSRLSFEEEQKIIWSLPLEDVSSLFAEK